MKTCFALEQAFQHYILKMQPNIQQAIVSTPKVSAFTRLNIYQEAYTARLIEALASTYTMLHQYMGEKAFNKLANRYIAENPSTYRSIRWYGDTLPLYLAQKKKPDLAELAQFEWHLSLVFDAADAPHLTLEDMAAIPPTDWPTLQFQLHPSVYRLSFYWNTVALWQALSDKKPLPTPTHHKIPIQWILWRKALVNYFVSLEADEAWALSQIAQGASFGELCEGLCQWVDASQAAMHAASLLKGWINNQLILSFR